MMKFILFTVLAILLVQYNVNSINIKRPNIILILTDDQDVVLRGLDPMVKTQHLLANEGATFVNAFTSSPICCPSRSSILSGQYAHNHKTHNNSKSGGCYGDFWQTEIEPRTFPALLQQNGYETFYAGKYLNEYFSDKVPDGWSQWFGLHGNSKYYNYSLNENGIVKQYPNEYLTDIIKNHTLQFLSKQTDLTDFFAMVSPPAPHAPFTAAERHQNLFPEAKAPKTDNFNLPSGPLDKHWLLTMEPKMLPEDVIENLDVIYRKRWQSLMAVDEMISEILAALTAKNILEDTYIIYTSDNGYHIGQFAQAFDKRQPYETDIRVPFLIKGPGIQEKSLIENPVALIDIAPTVLDLTNMPIPATMDGKSIVPMLQNASKFEERQILIEYWGEGVDSNLYSDCPWNKHDKLYICSKDLACHCQDSWNNTYICVRHLAIDLNFAYCQFKDHYNFVEAYDLAEDQFQMNNIGNKMLPSLRSQYSLALVNLSECIGNSCNRIY